MTKFGLDTHFGGLKDLTQGHPERNGPTAGSNMTLKSYQISEKESLQIETICGSYNL